MRGDVFGAGGFGERLDRVALIGGVFEDQGAGTRQPPRRLCDDPADVVETIGAGAQRASSVPTR